ncbi:MAG: hypothetical protein OEY93_10235 [Anaerolineae bacterium]|nr:hypothetical protein [Anaerolineae bacterium]
MKDWLKLISLLSIVLLAVLGVLRILKNEGEGSLSNWGSAGCPVTAPSKRFINPLEDYPSHFWYGTEALWTILPNDGIWRLSFGEEGFGQKTFWWGEELSREEEPSPDLRVLAKKINGNEIIEGEKVTYGYHEKLRSFILVGLDFPTAGCWEITGRYREDSLSFVIIVEME